MIDAYTDGGGNTGRPGSAACVLFLPDGVQVQRARKLGDVTNNIAEYQGVLLAIDTAQAIGQKAIRIHSDSQLIVNQILGNWKCKDDTLRELRDLCWRNADTMLEAVDICWVPRNENKIADGLCREVLKTPAGEFARRVESSSRSRPGGKIPSSQKKNPFLSQT